MTLYFTIKLHGHEATETFSVPQFCVFNSFWVGLIDYIHIPNWGWYKRGFPSSLKNS